MQKLQDSSKGRGWLLTNTISRVRVPTVRILWHLPPPVEDLLAPRDDDVVGLLAAAPEEAGHEVLDLREEGRDDGRRVDLSADENIF